MLILVAFISLSESAEAVEKPVRSLEAVFRPEKFMPFAAVPNMSANDFNRLWEINRAWVLANLAHTAYHREKTIRELVIRLGTTNCHVYEQGGAQAFLAVWSDKAVVSFRGTQATDLNDIIADALPVPAAYGSATVHLGFLRELDKIWPQIESDLKKEIGAFPKGIPVWATGHSLGGALATLAGMRYTFKEVITFGEPPIGRDIEKMFLGKRHLRYVNGEDPICSLPEIYLYYFGKPIMISDTSGISDWRYDHAIVYYAENLFKRNL